MQAKKNLQIQKYPDTCGRGNFCIWIGKVADSKISRYTWRWPTCGRGNFCIWIGKVADSKISRYTWRWPN